jgi:hypothetical protein
VRCQYPYSSLPIEEESSSTLATSRTRANPRFIFAWYSEVGWMMPKRIAHDNRKESLRGLESRFNSQA